MRWYEINGTYWGDKEKIIVGYGDNRLSVRSVKIFTDGAKNFCRSANSKLIRLRRSSDRWGRSLRALHG